MSGDFMYPTARSPTIYSSPVSTPTLSPTATVYYDDPDTVSQSNGFADNKGVFA
jgi:hypothetical protein